MTTAGVLTPSVGSWFPSGYYGHFRSKSRNDIYSEYRQFVKPSPPRVFFSRLKENPARHTFSHHDNRFSFITDATYLDQGVGKKRKSANPAALRNNPDLIAWDRPSQPSSLSVYRSTFDVVGPRRPEIIVTTTTMPQPLVRTRAILTPEETPQLEAEERLCTSYRYAFCSGSPNRRLLVPSVSANSEEVTVRPPSVRARRLRASSVGARPRESVADCLVWHHHPTPPPQPRPQTAVAAPMRMPVPEATATATEEEGAQQGDGE